MNAYVVKIHLDTDCRDEKELIDFCLNSHEQCVAIGWSCVYKDNEVEFHSYSEFFRATVEYERKIDPKWIVRPVFNIFQNAQADDLFWTTDLKGNYWICRAKERAKPYCDKHKDIGAIIPVEAYNADKDVEGQIKVAFRYFRGTAQRISPKNPEPILEYSKSVFNKLSGKDYYSVEHSESDILANFQAFDLQKLAILYLQIKYNYCVLPSFSVAEGLAEPEIECDLISRGIEYKKEAVVHVKAGNDARLDALDYADYAEDGYTVYLYAPCVENAGEVENVVVITDDELRSFYDKYKGILPLSIRKWESPDAK